MTGNTSATGGPIFPIENTTFPAPVEDDAFDALLQTLIVGIVGLPGNMVRPRWQDVLPQMPEPSVNWAAICMDGASNMADRMQITHNPAGTIVYTGDGVDETVAWEQCTAGASFYGPAAWANAAYLNDGLRVQQNREALYLAGVNVVKIGPRRQMHEILENKRVYRRVDMQLTLNRVVQRTYPIYNLLSANGTIYSPSGGGTSTQTLFTTDVGGSGSLPPYK